MKSPGLARYLLSFSIIFLGLLPQLSFSLSTDNAKPAQFISDSVKYNNETGVTIFTGHVTMNQGTTHLSGDQVTVYRTPAGAVREVIAVGDLAHYSTLPDNQTQLLNAFAKTIEYYPPKNLAILIKAALVTQGQNSFKGPYITYDTQTQVISSNQNNSNTQSVIVLQPNDLPGSHKAASKNNK